MWPFDKQNADLSPKVFGLGLSKTGTSSLGFALEILGFTHMGYRRDLVKSWHRKQLAPIEKALRNHSAFEDWPMPSMFEYVMRKFGASAYYVLTIRSSPEVWLESLKKHSLRSAPKNAKIRELCYGVAYPQQDEQHFLDFYTNHNASVVQLAETLGLQGRLRVLCWENNDGWGELCEFLGRDVPNMPFPKKNQAIDRPISQHYVARNLHNIARLSGS
ncbi:sulfotransferase [Devosia sp.]|uniref:sulfotransferase n=1 Tax=Devosia sp. TaxID=1871048 RepID=UPI003BA94842